ELVEFRFPLVQLRLQLLLVELFGAHSITFVQLILQEDRDEDGGVFESTETVFDSARQIQQVACRESLSRLAGSLLKFASTALHRNFPRDLMGRYGIAHREDDTDHLQIIGFEEGDRSSAGERLAQGANIDRLT